MANQFNEESSRHDIKPAGETHALNGFYHRLDIEQDKLIQRWINWSQSAVIGEFTLAVIYCLIALFFMLVFSFVAFLEDQYTHARVLLIFSFMTVCNLIYILAMKNERLSNTLVVLLLGGLCLYLFISGGVNQTGPLWYFVYPITALFILNLWEGLFMTVLLFWATISVYSIQVRSFNYDPYTGDFIVRFFAVYIAVAIMSFLYAYNRSKNDVLRRE